MPREIQLDGTEISILKALGLGGSDVDGATLIERCQNLEFAEMADALKGLMQIGYVDGDSMSFRKVEDFEKLNFRVNPGWSKELRDAISPQQEVKSKRVRRE